MIYDNKHYKLPEEENNSDLSLCFDTGAGPWKYSFDEEGLEAMLEDIRDWIKNNGLDNGENDYLYIYMRKDA